MPIYGRTFFESHRGASLESAKQIVPLLVEWIKPESVVDVGCGVGTWLSVFNGLGIKDTLGIDGDYVDRRMLLIPEASFMPLDLRQSVRLSRRFDLALTVEVAEHLPPECAQSFVQSLTSLADVVVFSAAVPGQGQDSGLHLNEQWPDYWAALFQEKGYVPIDCIRRRIWKNEQVCWWYAQNMLVYCKRQRIGEYAHLSRGNGEDTEPTSVLPLVHPRLFRQYADFQEISLTRKLWLLKNLVRSTGSHLAWRVIHFRDH